MRATTDAWVERHYPVTRLLDADTGRERPGWGPVRVPTMREEGSRSLPDLADESLGLAERLGGEV